QERLLEGVEAGDPHLGGAERVHPRDDADHLVAGVDVEREPADRVGVLEHRLPHDLDGQSAEAVGDGLGLRGDLAQRLLAVEGLAAGDEPDLEGVEVRGERGAGHRDSFGSFRSAASMSHFWSSGDAPDDQKWDMMRAKWDTVVRELRR